MNAAPGQPFRLAALAFWLRSVGDPDWRQFSGSTHSFENGVQLGWQTRLPRVPALFDRRTKDRSFEDSGLFDPWKSNYTSASGKSEQTKELFQEESKEDMMLELLLSEAEKYGERLRIGALGALEKRQRGHTGDPRRHTRHTCESERSITGDSADADG